jgi:uncharacterized protein (TIGR03032 family)
LKPTTGTRDPMSSVSSSTYTEINFEYSRNLPRILNHFGISLAVSTYQAGQLALLSAAGESLDVALQRFDRPMGIAVKPECLAVATRGEVWKLRSAASIAPRIEPAGRYDACFLARGSHVTGEIYAHEIHWAGDELWIVNTLFSCLCTLSRDSSFVPRWRPPFISALAAEDRCHLNGVALAEGRPRYVTSLAETDTPQGWRKDKLHSGCLIDVETGRTVSRGFAMPHSPRLHEGQLWLLDSGRGRLVRVDATDGTISPVAELPGYARGLAFHGPLAFVGLSTIRESATFGGVPVAERDDLKCGMAVVEVATGNIVAQFEFRSGVEEIFDVAVLRGIRAPHVRGPRFLGDEQAEIWIVPEPQLSPGSSDGAAELPG